MIDRIDRHEAVSRVVSDILLHDRFADEQDRADAMTAAIFNDLPDHGFEVTPTYRLESTGWLDPFTYEK